MRNTLVLFGAGHMGSAIVRGMLRSGVKNLRIIDPDASRLEEFSRLGLSVDTRCTSVSADDALMLAMPPQAFAAFAAETLCVHCHRGLVISVMAGIRIESIQRMLRVEHVVRAIPNTPSEVFEGMTAYCRSSTVKEELVEYARSILESFGRSVEVHQESLIDPATALCGGGPAFVAYFADALLQFGVKSGITDETARAITIQLLWGTAELLSVSHKSPIQLCREVMTPGGTTERGIWHFDTSALTRTVVDALDKSSSRSRELGQITADILAQNEVAK